MRKCILAKRTICVLMLLFFSLTLWGQDYQQRLDRARATKTAGWITGGLGTVLMIVGFSGAAAASSDYTADPTGSILISSLGGGLLGGGLGMVWWGSEQERRWEHVLRNAGSLTDEDRDAIAQQSIFIGMSEAALIASWGVPTQINRSAYEGAGRSDQYVYESRGVYVYIEGGRVTGWN